MSPARDVTIELAGERLRLVPERAAWWERSGMLLVADAHWGKAASFRAGGIAAPYGTTAGGLARLDALLARFPVRRLVFLGDLLHAREGRAPATLRTVTAWRTRHARIEMILVRGNHDRQAGDPPEDLEIACVDEPLVEPPFLLAHYPGAGATGCTIAGHLHPGVRLYGASRERERLPCFWVRRGGIVLPAFGEFTGLADVVPEPGDRVLVIADDDVIEVGGAAELRRTP